MKLIVAGAEKEYPAGTTVQELVQGEKVEMPLYVTVTVNDEFIQTEDRAVRVLQEGDQVEFLYFMGGGC